MVALCGIGTFLLRYLPIRWLERRRGAGRQVRTAGLQRFLGATGPAAIVALLVVSVLPLATPSPGRALAVLLALAALVLVRRQGGSLGLAVITSAGLYGALMHWLLS